MSTIALGSQRFSGVSVKPARTSLCVFHGERARAQGWRAVSAQEASLRLEAATASYFLSLSDDELRAENELGNALGNSAGFVDFSNE